MVAGGKLPSLLDLAPLKTDAWAHYAPPSGLKPTSSQGTAPAPATGFVQQKFQQQDDRITSLAEDIKRLKNAQVDMSNQLEQKITSVSNAVDETKQSFSSQLVQLQKDLETSLHGALQTQNNSISAGFFGTQEYDATAGN